LRTNIEAKLLLNQKHYILRDKTITHVEIDEIKENISSHTQDNIEDHITEEETNNNGRSSEENAENRNGEDAETEKRQRKNVK
jgi:hypothetical protein